MPLSLRAKLLSIVGASALALALVLGGTHFISAHKLAVLADVEGRLVPKLELGPRVESEFDHLRQGMQDAVAAQDGPALEATSALKNRIFELIAAAGAAIEPADAAALRAAIEEYDDTARGISRRLIAGETGEVLVEDMAEMQRRHQKAVALIRKTTRIEHDELANGFAAVRAASVRGDQLRTTIGLVGLVLVIGLSLSISRGVLSMVRQISGGFARFATGDFSQKIPASTDDELGSVAREANQMADGLERLAALRDEHDWLRAGQIELSDALRDVLEPRQVAERALGFLVRRSEACAGALYLSRDDGVLEAASQIAQGPAASFRPGEGMVGRAARGDELLVIDDVPPDYVKIRSGLGEAAPRALVFLPLQQLDRTVGVVELALFTAPSKRVLELFESGQEVLAKALVAARSREALQKLLEQTQHQAERLAAQEEELRQNNQELHAQQSSLRSANEELEAQRQALHEQNVELEEARRRVQQKADELAQVSSYKSQFLANMSHELRTPLNSMLLLSHLLAENEAGNLTTKQVEHSRTIHSAGQDLLRLINDVLDLAKIESGRQEVEYESVPLERFAAYARRVFEPQALDRGLRLIVEIAPGLPESITTDAQRVERILTNLIGNAIKFTERGQVALRIGRPKSGARFERADLSADSVLVFAVSDTGIGIPEEAQQRVFAPFEQLESRTDRRYAGTGLGLSIARESIGLMGGELSLESAPGKGSTFTCYVPLRPAVAVEAKRQAGRAVGDDRPVIGAGEPHLLVIEDDPVIAEQLVDVIHARRFKVVVANTGQEGLRLARLNRPRGIILDVKLPDIDGWTVMERLRQDPTTRSIPVHFLSASDAPERGLSLGAVGYLTKPASHADLVGLVRVLTPGAPGAERKILIVEDDVGAARSIVELLASEGIEARHAPSAGAALGLLEKESFGCLILDLGLPDMDGVLLLETLRKRANGDMPRVLVHTGRALTRKETRELEAYAEAVILKDGSSAQRLVEEVRLFVGHVNERLPRERPSIAARGTVDVSLQGAKIIVAEDDMRTVYALSALLRGKGADVLVAENGQEALDLLANHADVSGVLMDMMMPEMDGYEAMRRLRKDPRFSRLPVIALTAKALKGERERCLEAGASEYLTKPVDGDRLLATLKTWLAPGNLHGDGRQP